ncbi:hypothetical protein [Streptomyces tendae]|uniref:hypothetical protein n=1 Tax=Streptomyces tendae TaxID=1932 RepID=UPI0036A54B66
MTAGWCARTVRAAVLAAVCVLLAALGHTLMSGLTVPWWALAAGIVGTGGVAWCLAGRERGLPLVVTLVVAAQGALHSAFSLAQSWALSAAGTSTTPTGSANTGHAMASMDHDLGSMSMDSMDMGHMTVGHTAHVGHLGHMGHDMGGMSSFGMLAAHTLAALLCGLWLANGERATFRLLRAVAGWLAAPLRLPLALPVPPHRQCARRLRRRSDRAPRWLVLVHSITSRGPPAGTAVV